MYFSNGLVARFPLDLEDARARQSLDSRGKPLRLQDHLSGTPVEGPFTQRIGDPGVDLLDPCRDDQGLGLSRSQIDPQRVDPAVFRPPFQGLHGELSQVRNLGPDQQTVPAFRAAVSGGHVANLDRVLSFLVKGLDHLGLNVLDHPLPLAQRRIHFVQVGHHGPAGGVPDLEAGSEMGGTQPGSLDLESQALGR